MILLGFLIHGLSFYDIFHFAIFACCFGFPGIPISCPNLEEVVCTGRFGGIVSIAQASRGGEGIIAVSKNHGVLSRLTFFYLLLPLCLPVPIGSPSACACVAFLDLLPLRVNILKRSALQLPHHGGE